MAADVQTSLAVLNEPGGLEQLLLNANDLPLLAQVADAAQRLELTPAAFAVLAVRRFADRAEPDDWTALMSRANADDGGMESVVTLILRRAIADVNEVFQ